MAGSVHPRAAMRASAVVLILALSACNKKDAAQADKAPPPPPVKVESIAAVEAPAPLVAYVDQAHLAQHPQVLRDLRLGQPKPLDQVVDRPFPLGEQIEDLPPAGLGHRVERVRRGCCSGHGRGVYIPI